MVWDMEFFYDAQTSGGLLMAVPVGRTNWCGGY